MRKKVCIWKTTIIHFYEHAKNTYLSNRLCLYDEKNSSQLYIRKSTTIHLYHYVKNTHLGNRLRLHGETNLSQIYS